MSRDLKQALSTYVPGREIVVDKKTYESYGVYVKFPDNPKNRVAGEDWGDLDWLNWCDVCKTVFDKHNESLAARDMECPVCEGATVSSLQMYTRRHLHRKSMRQVQLRKDRTTTRIAPTRHSLNTR